ncbi:MAG TPA: T9SS type A sorting domain-containing protein [Bacteroidia bacterium]|nr:T9SS type A sorting domain-containing protein [Bacteroidia bacterium]
MKKLFLFLFLTTQFCNAQSWVNMMHDRNANFYDTQKEFYKYYNNEVRKQNVWHKKLTRLFSKETEQEIPGFEVFKRWEYFTAPRVYPTGRMFDGDQVWNEFQNYCKKNGIDQTNVAGNWTTLGPSSWQSTSYNPGLGRVNVVYVDPNNAASIFIGAPAGGLWHSPDTGNTWASNTDQLPTLGVSAIAVPLGNSNTIYMGTGDKDAGDIYGVGILKSTDGGITWNQTGLTWTLSQAYNVSKILIFPGDTSSLIASTSNGIYKSNNAGATWTKVYSGRYRDVEFMPGDTNIVFASGTSFVRSTDGGNTWTVITAGLPLSADVNHLQIGVTPADANYVYIVAGAAASSGFYGLYKSTNGGLTFSQQSSTPNIFTYSETGNGTGGQSWYDMTLCVSPSNKNEIYAGGINIWKSTDGGINWFIRTHWFYDAGANYPYVHADQHYMDFYGDKLYVGCDGGVFTSDDYGNTWTDITAGATIAQFYRLGASATDPTKIMAGAQDNGCNYYNNGQWTHVLGADGMETALDPNDPNILYACGQGGWLNRSDDGGQSMNTISTNQMGNGNWITPYMLDPNNSNTIYAGYAEMWKSTDNGDNWAQISNFALASNVSAFNIAPSNSNVIYVIVNNKLMYTDDGGNNWIDITSNLPNGSASINSIAIHPSNADRVWVCFSGSSPGNKIFYSGDAGTTWTNISGNLLNVSTNSIVYQTGTNDALYVGTDIGVFYTDSTLSNWQPFWNGLPNVSISELEINYVANKIRAASYGRGLWESDLYVPLQASPTANFVSDKISICPGESIQFSDASINAAPGWTWSFPGGTPSTSTLASPKITYATIGVYDVQLIVNNAFGTDTLLKTNYVNVTIPVAQAVPFTEGFENNFPVTDWKILNPDGQATWSQSSSVGGYGLSGSSAVINNYSYNQPGQSDVILTAPYNLTMLANPALFFDVAYAIFPGYADTLNVFYTTDCGVTRTSIFKKGGSDLATAPSTQSQYAPANNEWITYQLSLAAVANNTAVQFGFENINGYGNRLYLDNININQSTGVAENISSTLQLYPNPSSGFFIINDLKNELKIIEVFNQHGQLLMSMKNALPQNRIDLSAFENGLYIVKINTSTEAISHKITLLK